MKISTRFSASAAALLASPAAMASDPHGLLTLVVGVPLLLVASLVLGILLVFPPRQPVKVLAAVLFLPTFFYSLYVALDALTLFNDIGSENSMIGFSFFGLLALACLFFCLIMGRSTVPARRPDMK
ncbi:MAG: hypothetical protein EOO28_13925 [Comamonadaceae bacterium]|nr:MAG: hypothetical protein EOO28_13925 [Comamonadaceae bacterium]